MNNIISRRQVTTDEGRNLKDNYQLHFFMETSAKTGLNAQEMFIKCAEVLYKDYLQYNRNKPQQKEEEENGGTKTLTTTGNTSGGKNPKKPCCK